MQQEEQYKNLKDKASDVIDLYLSMLDKEKEDFLMSDDYLKSIISLEKKYKLTDDESKEIQEKTFYAILGMITVNEAIEDIVIALRSRSDGEIERIINDVKNQILKYAEDYDEDGIFEVRNKIIQLLERDDDETSTDGVTPQKS